jgi:glutaredoxin-like protein NrdH
VAEQVIVYTSDNCAPCDAVKDFLRRHEVPFEARNVTDNPDYLAELRGWNTLATPCVIIDGQRVRGFDRQRISELLGLSPAS